MLLCFFHRAWVRRVRLLPGTSSRFKVAFLSAAFLLGNAFGQSRPDEPKNKIRGIVLNAATQAPVPRALVYSADNRYAMLTDGEGQFEFTLPKEEPEKALPQSGETFYGSVVPPAFARQGDRLLVRARKPGFLDDVGRRMGTWASTGEQTTISLMPEGLIKGRVSLSTGDSAAGIGVQLFAKKVQDGQSRWIPQEGERTNSLGEFRFSGLEGGAYRLVTNEMMDNDPVTAVPGGPQFGFPPVYFPASADFAGASTIQLTAGQSVEVDLSLTRQPYFPVRIPVASGDAAGMNVSVEGARGPGYSLGYNPAAHRIEGLLPSGSFTVTATTYGAGASTGTVRIAVSGAPSDGPTMTLAKNNSIRLDVKEEFNKPDAGDSGTWSDGKHTYALHGARLHLQVRVESADDLENFSGGALRPPTGPNDDSLILDDVPPGRYWLRLSASRGYVASATAGGVDLLREPLLVGSGSAEPIEIKMRDDVAEIEGTVTPVTTRNNLETDPETGSRIPHAWVYCIPQTEGAGQFQQFPVYGDGKFGGNGMAPGSYLVVAFASEQSDLAYRDPEVLKRYEFKGQVVHLVAGQTTTVQVQVASSE